MNYDFKTSMMQEFEIKDVGLMHYFLGMEVYQKNEEIFIFQTKYAQYMLKKYGMGDCKSVTKLIAYGELLNK